MSTPVLSAKITIESQPPNVVLSWPDVAPPYLLAKADAVSDNMVFTSVGVPTMKNQSVQPNNGGQAYFTVYVAFPLLSISADGMLQWSVPELK